MMSVTIESYGLLIILLLKTITGCLYITPFAIVDTDLADQVKEEIKDKMAELNRRSGRSYVLSVSVGAAVAPVENFWFDDVMHIADKYMYEDKRQKPHNRI